MQGPPRLARAIVPALSILFLVGCSHPTTPSRAAVCPPGWAPQGSMSATIDGVAWRAGCVSPVTSYMGTSLYLFGFDQPIESGQTLGLAISLSQPLTPGQPSPLLVPGTYQLGGSAYIYGVDPYAILNFYCTPAQTPSQASACSEWMVAPDLGTGTVTISSFTSSTAAGTFSLSLSPVSGATGTKTVTNGVFNVTF